MVNPRTLFLLGLCVVAVCGCYYYEENYARTPSNAGPYYGSYPPPADPYAPAPDPYAAPADPYGPSDPAPDAPPAPEPVLEDEQRLADAGYVEEGMELKLRLVGVSPESQEALEREIRALPGVASVATVSFVGGELGLGLRFDGSLAALKAGVRQISARHGVKRFLIELDAAVEPARPLKVRIFAPGEGVRLAQSTVFVGVEVEGARNPTVTVNGIPAEPLDAPGRYLARIQCASGQNEIIAVARDASGASGEARRTVHVAAGDAAPADEALKVLIQGRVDDPGSTVTVDGVPVEVDEEGNYRVQVTLREGQEHVIVVVLDSLGNKNVRKIPVAGK